MARKTFFSKVKDFVLEKDDEEESAEDIDRRLEAELAEIESQEVETLDGSQTMMDDFENAGTCVYLMNLGPLYALVGGRDSGLGTRLPDACDHMFERFVPAGEGHGRMKGDYFVMSFVSLSREAGFRRAAQVINDIGLQAIGDRFKTIEIPNMLVAADPADLSNENGEFDPNKANAQVESGGTGCSLGEPGPDDPIWLKLSVKKATQAADLVKITSNAQGAHSDLDVPRPRRRGDPDWVEERNDRRLRISNDPTQMERRRGRDRRDSL